MYLRNVNVATGGSDDSCCQTSWRVNDHLEKFIYGLSYDWPFGYRHEVDDHNNLRHAFPSLDDD